MNAEKFKELLAGTDPYDPSQKYFEGVLTKNDSSEAEYIVTHGDNVVAAYQMDRLWKAHNITLLAEIESQNVEKDRQEELLRSLQIEDSHWSWLNKTAAHNGNEYEWFFLFSEGKVQGACLIYHPKESKLHAANIFYIEYVATAPWNRKSLLRDKEISGVGTILINVALNYAVNHLGLACGFSLHSLPQACNYYEKIGMVNIPGEEKEDLRYFEMHPEKATAMIEGETHE